MTMAGPIVLASRSPRRRQLLEEARWPVRIEVPDVDDGLLDCGETPADEWVSALAVFKATATAIMLEERGDLEPCTILGADTVCVLDGSVIGQPPDRAAARAMLESFVGVPHDVLTGVCLIDHPGGERTVFVDRSVVRWGTLDSDVIEAYLDTEQWRGKAGAYNLADRVADGWPIECEGDPTTVMGLPMRRLAHHLGAPQDTT